MTTKNRLYLNRRSVFHYAVSSEHLFFVQACGGVLVHKISWGESDLCNQSKWRVLVEDIELREESGSGFVLTWAFSKSKNMPLLFWSCRFFQKVLWADNSCEENICRTKLPKKKMRNSELLQKNSDLRWAIRFFPPNPQFIEGLQITIHIFFMYSSSGVRTDLWKWK